MQRGVVHARTVSSLTKAHRAIRNWATAEASCSLRPGTATAAQYPLHNALSRQLPRRSMHTGPSDAETQDENDQSPLTFRSGRFAERLPWADTNKDLKRGYLKQRVFEFMMRHKKQQRNDRHEWDYAVQLKEDPGHANYLRFWINAAWLLRCKAKDIGLYVAPDGFVRLSDVMNFEAFKQYDGEEFTSLLYKDPEKRFEVTRLPDLVGDKLQDIHWVRAKNRHDMPGVLWLNKRVVQVESINTAVYMTYPENWDYIKKHGIPPGEHELINLVEDPQTFIFENGIPERRQYLCVTIDCVAAAQAGVAFFRTNLSHLFAAMPHYISENIHIPPSVLRSAVLVDVSTTHAPVGTEAPITDEMRADAAARKRAEDTANRRAEDASRTKDAKGRGAARSSEPGWAKRI